MKDPICITCGNTILPKKYESEKLHLERKFCGRDCWKAGKHKLVHPWNRSFKGGVFA